MASVMQVERTSCSHLAGLQRPNARPRRSCDRPRCSDARSRCSADFESPLVEDDKEEHKSLLEKMPVAIDPKICG